MYLYVELWRPKAAWLALPVEERREYLSAVGPSIEELLGTGIELVGFAVADEEAPHDAGYRYMAAWRMPSRKHAQRLESAVDAAGWHRYFAQVNARGELLEPAAALEDMTALTFRSAE